MTTHPPITDADEAARGYVPRLRKLARKMVGGRPPDRRPQDFEEAVAAGMSGLAKAVRTFDPARGAAFESHAFACARQAILEYWAAESRAAGPAGEGMDPGDVACPASELPVGWQLESSDWIAAVSRRLPAPHGQLIRLHYLRADCADLYGCARAMRISVDRARMVHAEAIRLLRRAHGVPDPEGPPPGPGDRLASALAAILRAGLRPSVKALRDQAGCSVEAAMRFRAGMIADGSWPGVAGRDDVTNPPDPPEEAHR